ncbi:MAG: exodeoxyribonuclease VII large subunit [Cyclobacteriaceae bacterium]
MTEMNDNVKSDATYIHLSELTTRLKQVIDGSFGRKSYSVVAEISNLKKYDSGFYMELVEKKGEDIIAKINATIWRSSLHKVYAFESTTGQSFMNGISVLLELTVNYHVTYGLSLSIVGIDASFTLGNVELQKRACLERLVQVDGVKLVSGSYVSPNHSRRFPLVARRVAVIGNAGSDGYKDFIHELTFNEYGYTYETVLFQSQVQGKKSEEELLTAFRDIYKRQQEFDVVVVIRGGGSDLDLSIFDSYSIAKASALFPLPILAGIGHTRNQSICDLMVYKSLKTPTKVAQELVQVSLDFESSILDRAELISLHVLNFLKEKESHLRMVMSRLASVVSNKLSSDQARLESRLELIFTRALNFLDKQKARNQSQSEKLDILDPGRILKRGYAIVSRGGHVIDSGEGISVDEDLIVEMQNAIIDVKVNEVKSKS